MKKPSDLEAKNPLATVDSTTRGKLLSEYKELDPYERRSLIENLVESAMVLGITDAFAIKEWIGGKAIQQKSVTAAKEKILERWREETSNTNEVIAQDRARLIKASWAEVRECERMYAEAEVISDKVKIKALKRDWLQFISKLSFVDKLIEVNEAPMNIFIHDIDVNGE